MTALALTVRRSLQFLGLRNLSIEVFGLRISGDSRLRGVAVRASARGAGHSDHAYLGQLKREAASVGLIWPKASWLLHGDLRVAFGRWLRIYGGIADGDDGRTGLRARYPGLGLPGAGLAHQRADPRYT